ncbi:MAG TPA: hypothetical protein VGQ41_09860 [Pyrinomonadaceae bacterium]|jgi:hypothetical protein|nr:hypothetical protein [Pyrinomonadaceae bacterium]
MHFFRLSGIHELREKRLSLMRHHSFNDGEDLMLLVAGQGGDLELAFKLRLEAAFRSLRAAVDAQDFFH